MSLSIFSTGVLVLCLTCIFSSCRDERKQKQLQEIEWVLDREIEWLTGRISDVYQSISVTYAMEGKPDRMKVLYEKSDSVYVSFQVYYGVSKNTLLNNKEKLQAIEKKNSMLAKSLEVDKQLQLLYEDMRELGGVKFGIGRNFEVVKSQENVILAKEDSFKVHIWTAQKPYRFPSYAYKAIVDDEVLIADSEAVFHYMIPVDSTEKMSPGIYTVQGKIVISFLGKDSAFYFEAPYQIIPPICTK